MAFLIKYIQQDKNPEKKPTASFFAFLKGGSSPAKQVDLFPDDIIIACVILSQVPILFMLNISI